MLKFTLNGNAVAVDAPPDAPLLFVLNNDLDQHGAKFGCGLSQCGACTVLIDGEPVRSCQTAAQTAVGRSVTTLAGLMEDNNSAEHAGRFSLVGDQLQQRTGTQLFEPT